MTTPLAVHRGAAHDLLAAVLAAWIAVEVLLRLRTIGRRAALDWTFPVLVAAITAGFVLSFRAAHVRWAIVGGGWASVAIGLSVAVLGIALRVWAMLTLGRLFTFVVAIQDRHSVVDRGPYRLLRHPSYTGALAALLGIGIALDSWLAAAAIFLIPFAAVLVRIRVEEARLSTALGPAYQRYAARTHRLVPGIRRGSQDVRGGPVRSQAQLAALPRVSLAGPLAGRVGVTGDAAVADPGEGGRVFLAAHYERVVAPFDLVGLAAVEGDPGCQGHGGDVGHGGSVVSQAR